MIGGLGVGALSGGGAGVIATTAVPLLDAIGTASSCAVALRKLRAAYAGSCIKVRRSSDNTTQDIGFSGNNLDTASLLTFCGAGNGFIDTWYDQSGNARNLTQATTAAQPQIVTTGSLLIFTGALPCVRFDGSDDTLGGASFTSILSTAAYSAFTVGVHTGGGGSDASEGRGNPGFYSDASNVLGLSFQSTGAGSPQMWGWHYDGSYKYAKVAYTANTAAVFLQKYDGTNQKAFVNGGAGASVAASSLSGMNATWSVGKTSFTPTFMTGVITELVFFSSALSAADCNTLAANQAAYWGTSWSNIS